MEGKEPLDVTIELGELFFEELQLCDHRVDEQIKSRIPAPESQTLLKGVPERLGFGCAESAAAWVDWRHLKTAIRRYATSSECGCAARRKLVFGARQPSRWFESVPERSKAKDPAPLKVKEVWVEERRYVVCLNEEERRKDAHDREAIVAHLKEQLRNGDKSLVGNKGYRRYLKVEGSGHFVINAKQVKAEERYDGVWVLRTNTDYNAETVAHVYKALWTVEDIFHTTKSILETRPIYHKRNETIRGHVFCSFLALLLKAELERRMQFAHLEREWAQVLRRPRSFAAGRSHFSAKALSVAQSANQ